MLISLSVFIVGFADDKLDVKALNRIIVLFIIFSVSFSIHDSLKIEIIKFILVNSEDKLFYRNFDTTILSAALLVHLFQYKYLRWIKWFGLIMLSANYTIYL